MPPVPVPPEIDAFLAAPNRAVVATVRPDGTPHTAATWYDWEDGRVLMNMHEIRLRLGYLRANPGVALTVLADDWEQPRDAARSASSRSRRTRGCATSTGSRCAIHPNRHRTG